MGLTSTGGKLEKEAHPRDRLGACLPLGRAGYLPLPPDSPLNPNPRFLLYYAPFSEMGGRGPHPYFLSLGVKVL